MSVAVLTPIAGLSRVRQLAAGGHFALALIEDGTVMAWGGRDSGKLGDGEVGLFRDRANDIPTPHPVRGLSGVRQIAAELNGLALLEDGTVRTWGCNGYFDQGLGHKDELPNRLGQPKISGVVAGAVAQMSTFVVLRDGTLPGSGAIYPEQSRLFRVPTVLVSGVSGR